MTTLRKIASQIIRYLEAGNKTRDSKYNLQYVMNDVRQATHSIIKREYFTLMNEGMRDVTPLCIATYRDREVLNDDVVNRNYIALPSYAVQLPGGVGIQRVSPQTGNATIDRAMIITAPHELDLIAGSLFSEEVMKDQWMAEVSRDRIYFSERNGKTLLDEGIEEIELQQVVVDPGQIGEDDNYPVDPAQEQDIIKSVLAMYGYTAREVHDMVNDGNQNIR